MIKDITTMQRALGYLKTLPRRFNPAQAISYAPPLDASEVVKIASEVLRIHLSQDNHGRYFLKCPGSSSHSGGKSARRDCEFVPHGAPTLRCFHTSCSNILDDLNRSIRSACGKARVANYSSIQSVVNKAAAALVVGFDLPATQAASMLNDWGVKCEPNPTPGEINQAINQASKLKLKRSDEVGCLLKTAGEVSYTPAQHNPQSPQSFKLSDVSDSVVTGIVRGLGCEQAVYPYDLKELTAEIERLAEDFEYDHGYKPTHALIGKKYQSSIPPTIHNMKTIESDTMEHSVVG